MFKKFVAKISHFGKDEGIAEKEIQAFGGLRWETGTEAGREDAGRIRSEYGEAEI